ncbi:MAG: hypothetical protein K8H86_10850, partial [Ignavibacteriaceae bacterium]|nr:hypothetical protein [Ignavibacteriaceae bacterium]
MKKYLLVFWFTLGAVGFAQTKIIYTAVDYVNNEVRAAICDADGSNKYDLGFNRTYLPVWFGDNILFNSDTYIWQCDSTGENLKQLSPGYRVSVSHNQKKYAFYSSPGISIADTSHKVIKEILIDPWEDVSITWSKDDSKISYFNNSTKKLFLFDLATDSVMTFGDFAFHPLWNPTDNSILFNQKNEKELFDVFTIDSLDSPDKKMISTPGEMAVVPVWSNDGQKIAYLSIHSAEDDSAVSDMLKSDIILYDKLTGEKKILADNAGFTDQAFPQVTFDANDEYIYY